MKKLLALLLALLLLAGLAACTKEAAPAADAPLGGQTAAISPITEYLAGTNLTEEAIFPAGADGAVVQDGQIHFNPHGANADDWYYQVDIAIMQAADNGVIANSVKKAATATLGGTTYTISCGVNADDDWFFALQAE